ncbi:MAG TPA: DUF4249 domain-containing protein [Bacteroidia bacterium]|nr:DUF4249 domain-containing protein [Bacteroidia bacterium]
MTPVRYIILLVSLLLIFSGCEKEIEVDLPRTENEIVVEAYINQLDPLFNYVILSRSVNFFQPGVGIVPVKGAQVFITEGTVAGTDTNWNTSGKWQLTELFPDSIPGIYFSFGLTGKLEHVYKLEVFADGKYVHSITNIPPIVPLDSLSYTVVINPDDNKDTGRFMSIHFLEPVPKGNCYRAMYRIGGDTSYFGWGSIFHGDDAFNDDFVNGVYRNFTYGRNFRYNDTVNYYFSCIDRMAFNFWESYETIRNNGGPFSTPVQLKSNVQNAIGSFTGMAVTKKKIIIRN